MKCIVVSPKNRTVYNFRGDLIKSIIERGYETIVVGPNQDDVAKITELGAKFVEVPMNKNGVNPIADLKYQKELKKLIKRENPDVVFSYTSKPSIYGTIAAKKACKNVRAVAMITGAGYAFASESKKAKVIRRIMSFLYKRAFKLADVVIFQNNDDKQMFERLKIVDANKTALINGSGVNLEKFKKAEFPDRTTFFMLARIMKSKGVVEYLEACEAIKGMHPEVRCMLLGACENIQDSIQREYLDTYINNGIIEYFGETSSVEDYYKQCSVYVLPSYREGTPRTVLEAMAMGRPIITTDAPGCKDTVIDGETGFLVPVKDSKAIVEKMLEFVNNPDLIKSMGDASYRYCQEKYDVVKVNQTMRELMGIKDADN